MTAPSAANVPVVRGGRSVVLKKLDDDCLLDGQLHPSIKLRLERVRELPVPAVANLLGVERDADGSAHLVWEFVPGTPLAEVKSADWLRLCREVVLAVQSLHAAGIVHGAIHGGNVIVDDTAGQVRLAHVSPLLYTDPEHDAADVVATLDALVNERSPNTPLAAMLAEASAQQLTLSELYARLAAVGVEPAPDEVETAGERHPRTRYVVAAGLIALIGAAMSLAIYWRLTASESQPYAPPVARSLEP